MTRKIVIIMSVVVIIFLIILGSLFFISRMEPREGESPIITKVREVFPFGKPSRDPDEFFPGEFQAPSTNDGATDGTLDTKTVPRLRKIHGKPTSGSFQWFETLPNKEVVRHIRYVDRATGHVYDTTTNSLDVNKISNTTLPKIYEAYFGNKDAFLGRFLDEIDEETIKTYAVSLRDNPIKVASSTSTSTPIQTVPKTSVGNYLDENIRELALSPSKNKIIYSIYENNGGSILISNFNGTNKTKIFSSVLREWLLSWGGESTAIISTKPSGLANGFAYSLNTTSGELLKIAGNIPGLTILPSPQGQTYLLGTGGGSLSTSILKKSVAGDQVQFLARTLPEKCVWSKKDTNIIFCAVPTTIPSGVYPDDWYQGLTSFNDTLWKINTNTAQTNVVFIPEREILTSLDMINLELSSDDSYITFINKKDLSLWGYQINLPVVKTATSTATSTPNQRAVGTSTASTTNATTTR